MKYDTPGNITDIDGIAMYKQLSNLFIILIINVKFTKFDINPIIVAIPNTNANNIILPFVAPNLNTIG